MNDFINTLSHAPLPTILVVAGIVFWVLAIAGSLAGKITVEPGKQKTAGVVGTALIVLGLMLSFFVPGSGNQNGLEATPKPPQTTAPSTAQTTGSPAPQATAPPIAQTTASPTPPRATAPPSDQTKGPRPGETNAELPPVVKSDQTSAKPSPGVNCTGTGTPDEVEICGNARLAGLDRQLSAIFQALLKRSDKDQQTKLKREESTWVQQRGKCQSDERCLTEAYKSRIDQLQLAP